MQQSLFGSIQQPATGPSVAEQLSTLLPEATFTVVDLETTGLSAKRNAITELVAIQYKNGLALEMFSSLVAPTEEIPPEVEALTGITNAMVKNAPPLLSVLHDAAKFMGETPVIVGHNVSFDLGFLREKLSQNGMGGLMERLRYERALCTKVLAQKILPGLPSYEGIVVATHCGVVNPNPHRAENDVRMSADILFRLIERLNQQDPSIQTVADLLAFQGPLSP
jgi:DNA polymerase III subunit epsilon